MCGDPWSVGPLLERWTSINPPMRAVKYLRRTMCVVDHTASHCHLQKLNSASVCSSSTYTSSTGSMFIGVHTNSQTEFCTWDRLDPEGNGCQPYILTASLSGSLVENVTLFCSSAVQRRVSDPFPLTVMNGTLFATAIKSQQCNHRHHYLF